VIGEQAAIDYDAEQEMIQEAVELDDFVEHDGKDEQEVQEDEAVQEDGAEQEVQEDEEEQDMHEQNFPLDQPEAEVLSFSASSSRKSIQKDSIVVMKESPRKFMSPKRKYNLRSQNKNTHFLRSSDKKKEYKPVENFNVPVGYSSNAPKVKRT